MRCNVAPNGAAAKAVDTLKPSRRLQFLNAQDFRFILSAACVIRGSHPQR